MTHVKADLSNADHKQAVWRKLVRINFTTYQSHWRHCLALEVHNNPGQQQAERHIIKVLTGFFSFDVRALPLCVCTVLLESFKPCHIARLGCVIGSDSKIFSER